MPWWEGIPKTFVEETLAKAAEVNENFQAVKEALLYLLSEEEHSPFPQLGESAKRILTMASNVVLLNGSGASQFAQLTTTAERKINRGSSLVTSGNQVGFSTITHELGKTPAVVVASIWAEEGGKEYRAWASNYTSSTFKLWAARDAAASLSITVSWVAIS